MNRREFLAGLSIVAAGLRVSAQSNTDMPVMLRTEFVSTDEPAYLSNGLIGIRPGPNPLEPALTLVAGFVGRHGRYAIESLLPAPDPMCGEISLVLKDGSEQPLRLTPRKQSLSFANGELITEMTSSGIDVRVIDFAARGTPCLLCRRITVSGDQPVRIRLRVDSRNVQGSAHPYTTSENREVDAVMVAESQGALSTLGVALAVVPENGTQRAEGVLTFDCKPSASLSIIGAMVPSLYHSDPPQQAIRMASWGRMLGFDRLREQNADRWRALWNGRVVVDAGQPIQRALDAAYFYLHSSVHPSTMTGMPPFGLSQWEHYFGHSFWDTETWSFLPVLLTAPDTARALVDFRLRGLDNARRVARLYGFRGAQFPWEASMLDGTETTPVFAATGWAEQHVVPDVALGMWQYALASDDREFLRQSAWPVIRDAATWISSRGEWSNRGYEIRNIMGPDEGANNLANSAYVTIACQAALRAAQRCATLVGEKAPRVWEDIASRLILPMDGRGVPLTWEGASRGAFPDFAFLLPFHPQLPAEPLRKSFDEFRANKKRQHTIGFASAAQSAAAAFLGDRDLAAELFDLSWRPFWMEPFGLIKEATTQDYGCFITDFGALLQAVLIGFTGLRIVEGDWAKHDATLPSGWKSVRVNTIYVRGEPHSLVAEHGRKAQLSKS